MFDLAASIETEKDFDHLTVSELVEAVRKRLENILAENNIEAFGFCDSCDVE